MWPPEFQEVVSSKVWFSNTIVMMHLRKVICQIVVSTGLSSKLFQKP